jgi:hypothetical protein
MTAVGSSKARRKARGERADDVAFEAKLTKT